MAGECNGILFFQAIKQIKKKTTKNSQFYLCFCLNRFAFFFDLIFICYYYCFVVVCCPCLTLINSLCWVHRTFSLYYHIISNFHCLSWVQCKESNQKLLIPTSSKSTAFNVRTQLIKDRSRVVWWIKICTIKCNKRKIAEVAIAVSIVSLLQFETIKIKTSSSALLLNVTDASTVLIGTRCALDRITHQWQWTIWYVFIVFWMHPFKCGTNDKWIFCTENRNFLLFLVHLWYILCDSLDGID